MATTIQIAGFETDAAEGRAWTVDARWGLVRNEDGTLTLLDSDGAPSNHSLTDSDAAYIINRAGLSDDLMRRWDYYASAQ